MNGQTAGEVTLSILGGIFKALFPHERKVKEYLDQATTGQ